MTLLGLTARSTCFKWKICPIAVLPKDALERIFEETGGFFMAESAGFALAKDYRLVSATNIVKRACRDTVGQGRPPRAVLEDEVAPKRRWIGIACLILLTRSAKPEQSTTGFWTLTT